MRRTASMALRALLVGAMSVACARAPAPASATEAAAPREEPAAPARQTAELSEAELDRLTAEVADRLRCPVCRNQSILESPSELAREMQGVIRERLAAGESPEEVKAYFVSRYGEWVLLRPEPRGATLLVYVLPALAFLVGGGLLGWRLRRWAAERRAPPRASSTAAGRAPTRASEPTAGDFSQEEEAWLRDAIAREP